MPIVLGGLIKPRRRRGCNFNCDFAIGDLSAPSRISRNEAQLRVGNTTTVRTLCAGLFRGRLKLRGNSRVAIKKRERKGKKERSAQRAYMILPAANMLDAFCDD